MKRWILASLITIVLILSVQWIAPLIERYLETRQLVNATQYFRAARSCLKEYAESHDGAMPSTVRELDDYCEGTLHCQPPYKHGQWDVFYFVGNLTSRDPPETPIMFFVPVDKKSGRADNGKSAAILCLNGNGGMYQDVGTEFVRRLVSSPWEFVRKDFKDAAAFEAFKKRLVIRPPVRPGPVPSCEANM